MPANLTCYRRRDDVPVVAFARMVMTEPVSESLDHHLDAEMPGMLEPGSEDGVLHDFPPRYR